MDSESVRIATGESEDEESWALRWVRSVLEPNRTREVSRGEFWEVLVSNHDYHFVTSKGERLPGRTDVGERGGQFAAMILDRAVAQAIARKTANGMWQFIEQ